MKEINHNEDKNNFLEFKKKYDTNNSSILKINNWAISLRPCQCTYGSLLLYLDRPCQYFNHLTNIEQQSLGDIFSIFEKHALLNLKATKINILQLMLVDNHLHFHLFPRYDNHLNRYSDLEIDKFWPKPIDNYNFECIETSSNMLLNDSQKICQI